MSVCVCVRERERERVYGCVGVRERVCVWVGGWFLFCFVLFFQKVAKSCDHVNPPPDPLITMMIIIMIILSGWTQKKNKQ